MVKNRAWTSGLTQYCVLGTLTVPFTLQRKSAPVSLHAREQSALIFINTDGLIVQDTYLK